MSHSTHVGFRAPPTTAFNCRSRGFPLLVRRYWLGLPLFLLSFTVGVGNIATTVCKLGDLPRLSAAKSGPADDALGFGHNPDPVTLVGSACVVRSHNFPSCIKPQRGKVTEDHGKSSSYKHWAVFHPDVAGSYLTDNSRHLCPKP